MNKTTTPLKTQQISYETNPFTLIFREFTKGFKINQNVSIALLVGGFIIGIGQQLGNSFGNISDAVDSSSASDETKAIAAGAFIGLALASGIISIFVETLWKGFNVYAGLYNARGESIGFKQCLRAALGQFWKVLAISWLIGLVVLAFMLPAIILLIATIALAASKQESTAVVSGVAAGIAALVGIAFSIWFSLSRSLAIYAGLGESRGIMESLSRSAFLTRGRLIELMGLGFAAGIIPFISPVLQAYGSGAYYLQSRVYRDSGTPLPKVHILSWLPLLVIVGLVLLVALVAGLIALVALANR